MITAPANAITSAARKPGGAEMDKGKIETALERCLLTDEEMALGEEAWKLLEDPLPRGGMEAANHRERRL